MGAWFARWLALILAFLLLIAVCGCMFYDPRKDDEERRDRLEEEAMFKERYKWDLAQPCHNANLAMCLGTCPQGEECELVGDKCACKKTPWWNVTTTTEAPKPVTCYYSEETHNCTGFCLDVEKETCASISPYKCACVEYLCWYSEYSKKCVGYCPPGKACLEIIPEKCMCAPITTPTLVVIEELNLSIKEKMNFTIESMTVTSTTSTSKATSTTKVKRTPKCGDGFIDSPEKCDPKATPTGCKASEKCCPEECKCYPND